MDYFSLGFKVDIAAFAFLFLLFGSSLKKVTAKSVLVNLFSVSLLFMGFSYLKTMP